MIITTEYSEADLHFNQCKSCGEKTEVLNDDIDARFSRMCPDCIEAIKFEEATS